MGMLVWVMIGLAIWHFTVWLPEHFWGGIAGAFAGAMLGSIVITLIISGFSIPGPDDTDLLTAVEAVPGTLIGMAAFYFEGLRRERLEANAGGAPA